jgi:hypothetical protein
VLAGAGQHERALELFAKIRSADRAVRVAQAAESAARSLLEAAVRNDDDTAAERLIDALPRLGSRVRMRLVRERARGRPVDLATVLPLVDSFGFPEQRAEAAIGLVPVVAASGQPEIARALADRVVEELRMITTPRRRDPIQVGLAAAVEESGDHDRALKIARAITGPNEKLTALMGLARSAARSGDAVRAGRLIELIQPAVRRHLDGARRDEFLLEMLEILADAAAITLDPRQGEAFADRAEEIGRAVDHRKIEAAARVVAVFAEAAAKAVDAVRANALGSRSAAVTQALPGSDIELADEIGQLSRRAMTDGHRKRAVTLAQHVTIPDRQAELLCELALLGPEAGAVELVGQAFRAGRWTIPMVAFAHISPDQFIEVVPQLLERHRPSRLQQEDAADRISELGS